MVADPTLVQSSHIVPAWVAHLRASQFCHANLEDNTSSLAHQMLRVLRGLGSISNPLAEVSQSSHFHLKR